MLTPTPATKYTNQVKRLRNNLLFVMAAMKAVGPLAVLFQMNIKKKQLQVFIGVMRPEYSGIYFCVCFFLFQALTSLITFFSPME